MKMNIPAIRLFNVIKGGVTDPAEIMEIMRIKKTQFYDAVKNLVEKDYIEKKDSNLIFKQNPKSILLRDIAATYNIEALLHDSNELIFTSLAEPATIEGIHRSTGLSLPTIHRVLSELRSIGAIKKERGTISIDPQKDKLLLLAKLLNTEKERKKIEPYAQIIYQDRLRTLKKVPKGKQAEGELTGFSLFSDYGVEYHTTHDYYADQDTSLQLADILIHAILAASKEQDKQGIVMAMIFYLKHKQSLDTLTIRRIARDLKVSDVWTDAEGYLRNAAVKNQNLFLPWQEFEEKAKLYGIPTTSYTLPIAYPDLFKDIGQGLTRKTQAYLIGGENMRLKGLKPRTKDCDLVVSDDRSFLAIIKALKGMGYESINKSRLAADDARVHASDILEHSTRSRIDIFTQVVAHKLALSDDMKKRAKLETHGNLRLGILANEDVFLLKGVTLREGDTQDMARLAQTPGFDWRIVWREMERQEKERFEEFSETLLISLDYLSEQTGIRAPFYRKLVRRVLDYKITQQIRHERRTLADVVSILKGGDITENMIRNRIRYLEKKRLLRKVKHADQVYLESKKHALRKRDGDDQYRHAEP